MSNFSKASDVFKSLYHMFISKTDENVHDIATCTTNLQNLYLYGLSSVQFHYQVKIHTVVNIVFIL